MNVELDSLRPMVADLCRRFHVRRLDLFGSAATGSYDPQQSDLDFLVDFLPEAESDIADAYLDLLAALREKLGREVDLVMERAIRNPYFLRSVNRTRVLLYAA